MFGTRARAPTPSCLVMSDTLVTFPRVQYSWCHVCRAGMEGQAHLDYHLTQPEHHFTVLSICGEEMVWCDLCGCWLLQSHRAHLRSEEHRALLPAVRSPVPYIRARRGVPRPFITPEERAQISVSATNVFYGHLRALHYGWFTGDEPMYSSASDSDDDAPAEPVYTSASDSEDVLGDLDPRRDL